MLTKLIIGPCAIESMEHALYTAGQLKLIQQSLQGQGYLIEIIYKSCFNKANRSSVHSYHGIGLSKGREILAKVKETTGLKVTSDVHTVEEARAMGPVLDIIQIPAHMCRYTDLIAAAAGEGKPINVKLGQFLSPKEAKRIVEKIREAGNTEEIILSNRGFQFGYNNLVVDMRSFGMVKQSLLKNEHNVKTCIDATHSVQLPGDNETESGGQPAFIETIALAGAAAGADYLFMEAHNYPLSAPCDSQTMVDIIQVEGIVVKFLKIQGVLVERYRHHCVDLYMADYNKDPSPLDSIVWDCEKEKEMQDNNNTSRFSAGDEGVH